MVHQLASDTSNLLFGMTKEQMTPDLKDNRIVGQSLERALRFAREVLTEIQQPTGTRNV